MAGELAMHVQASKVCSEWIGAQRRSVRSHIRMALNTMPANPRTDGGGPLLYIHWIGKRHGAPSQWRSKDPNRAGSEALARLYPYGVAPIGVIRVNPSRMLRRHSPKAGCCYESVKEI